MTTTQRLWQPPTRAHELLRVAASAVGWVVPIDRLRTYPLNRIRYVLLQLANAHLSVRHRPFTTREVANGFTFTGSTSDLIQRHVRVFGIWEPPLTHLMLRQLRRGDVFLDFGANAGYFTVLAATAVGPAGHVYAFECLPSMVSRLRANVAANRLDNVTVVPAAAGDREGTIEVFSATSDNLGRSGTEAHQGSMSEGTVPLVVAADQVPEEHWQSVGAIKIDVEGDDLRVLHGLKPVLEALRPDAVVAVEVSPHLLSSRGESARELMDYMTDLGFTAHSLPNEYHPRTYRRPPAGTTPLNDVPRHQADVIFRRI